MNVQGFHQNFGGRLSHDASQLTNTTAMEMWKRKEEKRAQRRKGDNTPEKNKRGRGKTLKVLESNDFQNKMKTKSSLYTLNITNVETPKNS
jgi:hypothetical protein